MAIATTADDIRDFLEDAGDEFAAFGLVHDLDDPFPDLKLVCEQRGDEARWGSRDWVIYRNGVNQYIGVEYYSAATEVQESYWEGVVAPMRRRVEATVVFAQADADPGPLSDQVERPPGRPEAGALARHAAAELDRLPSSPDEDRVKAAVLNAVAVIDDSDLAPKAAAWAGAAMRWLLRRLPMTPLTDDPDEWQDRSSEYGSPMWQNTRHRRVWSTDGYLTGQFYADPSSGARSSYVDPHRERMLRHGDSAFVVEGQTLREALDTPVLHRFPQQEDA